MKTYKLLGANGAIMEEIKTTGLQIGQVVSYGDQANTRKQYVVISEKPETKFSHGQPCICRENYHKTDVSITSIEGPGGWEMVDEIATGEEIQQLKIQNWKMESDRQKKQAEKQIKTEENLKRGLEILERKAPPWAKGIIVGIYEINKSDSMTDYFITKDGKVLILGFSKHNRDLFPEMRKFATQATETKHLATASTVDENGQERTEQNKSYWTPSDEHREKYSGGAGFYLKASNHYTTGWKIEKWDLTYPYHKTRIAELLGEDPTIWKA